MGSKSLMKKCQLISGRSVNCLPELCFTACIQLLDPKADGDLELVTYLPEKKGLGLILTILSIMVLPIKFL